MPKDDDDFDVDTNDDVDTTETDDDDDDGGKKGGPSDDERTRMRNSIKAARRERDEFKGELGKLRREVAELKSGKTDDKKDDGKADAERDRDADERAHARYRPMLIKAEATASLVKAGAKPDRVARLTKLLDVDEISVDEKGNVDSDDLEAEVDRLKEEMPELFRGDDEDDRKPARRPTGGRRDAAGAGRGKPSTGGASKSTAQLAKMLTGGR